MERGNREVLQSGGRHFLSRRWLTPRGVMGATAAALVILGTSAFWLTRETTAQAQFLTQNVVIGDLEEAVTAQGTLQPLQFVDVGTQVSGQVKKIHVTYGDVVKQGQLLAEIDPTVYRARVNGDEAQLLNLRAQLIQHQAQQVFADQQFERQQGLLSEDATSRDTFDTAQFNQKKAHGELAALEAQIKQAEFTLEADKANLGYTTIYAPMAGTIVDIVAKQGQTLNANQQAPIVLRIADMATMTVWAEVSEADEPKLRIGMPAYFTTLGNADRRYTGTLRQVLPTPKVVNNVVLYNAVFDVAKPDHSLLPQMSAQVFFLTADAHQVPLVPVGALKRAPSHGGANSDAAAQASSKHRGNKAEQSGQSEKESTRYSVRVLDDDKPVTRIIEVGAMSRLMAEVRSGLKPGDEVIVEQGNLPAPIQNKRGGLKGVGGGPRI